MIRTHEDIFSGRRIYPAKGKIYVRGDSKVFRFQNGKSESLFLQRKNPRRISWTVLFRRQHRKGISEEVAKKRSRRTVKSQRAIVGATLDVIKEKRSLLAREAARKTSSDDKNKSKMEKQSKKAKLAVQGLRGQNARQVSKQGARGFQQKFTATTR